MALEKVIIKLTLKTCINLLKFDGALQGIKEKFQIEGCPPKEEIIALNAQKNQIQSALETIAKPIAVLDKTATTVDNILTALDIAIKIIKKLPFPVAVPPGAGIPANVLTTLSDVLDLLGEIVKTGKSQIGGIPIALKFINKFLQAAITTLNSIDTSIGNCLIEEVNDSIEWSPVKDYKALSDPNADGTDGTGNKVSVTRYYEAIETSTNSNPTSPENSNWELLDSTPKTDEWKDDQQYLKGDIVKVIEYYSAQEDNKNKYPPDNSDNGIWAQTNEETAKQAANEALASEINLTLLDTGPFDTAEDNALSEEALLELLMNPPGLFYNGWYLRMEIETGTTSFLPRRRITAEKALERDLSSEEPLIPLNPEMLFNDYSWSSSVEVLVNEMKFRIDTLNLGDLDLSLIPPPLEEVLPDEKELKRDTSLIQIQSKTYGDWMPFDMHTTWANEIYDIAWDLHIQAIEAGEGHWIYDKAINEGVPVLEKAIDSINWSFQTGRRNLKSWIKSTFGASDEQAQEIFDKAYKLGRRGLKNSQEYDPTNNHFLHTVRRAVQNKRFKNDTWEEGVNVQRQAAYEIAWTYWDNGELNITEWNYKEGVGPVFVGNHGGLVRLGVGQNATGQNIEILGANVYDDPNSDGIDPSTGLFINGLFSRKPDDPERPTGIPNEGDTRILRHFKKVKWNGVAWVEVSNPNAPWL